MADGKFYVRFYGNHTKKVLFIGTQTECMKYITSHASDHIKMADGRLLMRVLEAADGNAYDVGQAYMYQIIEADGSWAYDFGIDQVVPDGK